MKIYVAINHYSTERSLGPGDFESKAFRRRFEAEEYCNERLIELCNKNYHPVSRILETEMDEELK